MDKAIFPVMFRVKSSHLKFAKLLKRMFGVGFKRDILRSKDVFFSVEEFDDRYRVRLSRVVDKRTSINVYAFNGKPAFNLSKDMYEKVGKTSTGISVSNIGDTWFLSPGGSDGYFHCGIAKNVLLPDDFNFGHYYINIIERSGAWCLSLNTKKFDGEIQSSTIGGSVALPLASFTNLDFYYDENNFIKGVNCEYDYKNGVLDLLRVPNDSQS